MTFSWSAKKKVKNLKNYSNIPMNKVVDLLQIVTNGFLISRVFYPHAAFKRKFYEKIATNNLFSDFRIMR